MEEELRLLGLNDVDIKVYLTLLKIGENLASQIAIRSGIPRASVYDILERLEQEGLVAHIIKDYKKYFSASDPKTIIGNLDYTKKRLQDIIPKLEEIKNKEVEENTKTEVFAGVKGLQTIMNMILVESREMFVLGASRKSMQVLPFFMEKWHKERIKKRLKANIIYNDAPEIRASLSNKETQKILGIPTYWRHRFLSVRYSSPLMTLVFGNKTALIMWKRDFPSVILIERKDIAGTYKQYILSLWKQAKK